MEYVIIWAALGVLTAVVAYSWERPKPPPPPKKPIGFL